MKENNDKAKITIRSTYMQVLIILTVMTMAFVAYAGMHGHEIIKPAAFVWSTTVIGGVLGFAVTLAKIGKSKIDVDVGGFTPTNWNVTVTFICAMLMLITIPVFLSEMLIASVETAVMGLVTGIAGGALGVLGALIDHQED